MCGIEIRLKVNWLQLVKIGSGIIGNLIKPGDKPVLRVPGGCATPLLVPDALDVPPDSERFCKSTLELQELGNACRRSWHL